MEVRLSRCLVGFDLREQHRVQYKVKSREEELRGQERADKEMEKGGALILLWQALKKDREFEEA